VQLKLFLPITVITGWTTAFFWRLRGKNDFIMSDEMRAILESFEPGFAEQGKALRPPRFEDIAPDGAFPICDGYPRIVPSGEDPYKDTFG
jgi:hypothetical protein